ncbi:hypothetical protein GQ457_03G009210 [Hibiscus cannabinus]
MIYRLHNLLHRLLSGTGPLGSRHRFFFIFLFLFTPLKRIAPQEGSSVIVVFVAKAPTSRRIYDIYLGAVHTIEFVYLIKPEPENSGIKLAGFYTCMVIGVANRMDDKDKDKKMKDLS